MLNPTIKEKIKAAYEKLNAEGKIHTRTQLEGYYKTFGARFGPEVLKRLDGTELLTIIHGSRDDKQDSLAYWLEYKTDDEFPPIFGSIKGGSALKFRVYVNSSGKWITGTSQNPRVISEQAAVKIAREQRDQLLRGCELLDALHSDGTDADYRELQQHMLEAASDVCETAWAHKYFSLLYPDKLEDFHVPRYQRFNLIKILQAPPEGTGRYIAAGRYVAIAKELDLEINQLTATMCSMNCTPYRYWRIGTRNGETNESYWELMKEGNYVSIGWRELGDLTEYTDRWADDIKKLIKDVRYSDKPSVAGKKGQEVFHFIATISEGDLVMASDGARVLGVGKITGPYAFSEALDFPHLRPVQWLDSYEWKVPVNEGLLTTVHEMHKADNLVQIEKHVQLASESRYWIEKTLVKGRTDRISGDYAVGKALWSPQTRSDGNDIYAAMREVQPGDVILHLTDNKGFSGVSVAASSADPSFIGLQGTDWAGRNAYLIRLKDYVPLDAPLLRQEFLEDPEVFKRLTHILESHKGQGLFYNREHDLNQGAYITEAPTELVDVLNSLYHEKTGHNLPHVFVTLPPPPPIYTIADFVEETGFSEEMIQSWKRKIERKQHIIFQGPPGTGKTFIAERLAKHLTSEKGGFWKTIQFHPAYSYEDFIQGIRPTVKNGTPFFDIKNGRFLEFCRKAADADPNAWCVLIIDEINRANLPRVFGELMYLLEYREREIPLAYEGNFRIPKNVFVIGTMNTADRSIRLFDHALRRRFSFVCLKPNYDVLRRYLEAHNLSSEALIALLREINQQINDPRYEVGISFFLQDGDALPEKLQDIWQGEIEPYLEEYFYDSPTEVGKFRWAGVKEKVLKDWMASE